MRIAVFDNQQILGGPQQALLDLVKGLQGRAWEVVAILGAGSPLSGPCERLGVSMLVETLPAWTGESHPFSLLRDGGLFAFRLARRLRREGIRLLYANTPECALIGGMAMRLNGGRAFWRVHRLADTQRSLNLSHLSYRLVEQVHVPTPTAQDVLAMLFGNTQRLRLIPPGIATERYPIRELVARKMGELPVVGMLGGWAPREGQETLVKAFRLLQEVGLRARLRLAGRTGIADGERYRSVITGIIKAAGLGERITVEGPVEDTGAFFAACDIVTIPTTLESSARLALEVAAIGRPVIASRVGGLQDIIDDGHTGLLVPASQPRALADALALLLASPALREEMGRQAHLHVVEHFALDQHLDVVETAITGAPTRLKASAA